MNNNYVCVDCGVKHLTEKQKSNGGQAHTFHINTCTVCSEKKSVTHIKAYNYLNSK